MEDKKLQTLLTKLHTELEHTTNLDDKGRALLRDLDVDIRKLLDNPVGNVPQAPVLERLETSIKHLEVTHPSLTMALSELLTALNNAGI
jgi:hypothetical protein